MDGGDERVGSENVVVASVVEAVEVIITSSRSNRKNAIAGNQRFEVIVIILLGVLCGFLL